MMKYKTLPKAIMAIFIAAMFSNTAFAGSKNYKLKIHNAFMYPIKMAWYCDGKTKDKDTFPIGKKTRELSYKKCKNIKDLSIRVWVKHSFGYASLNAYMRPSAYVKPLPDFKGADSSKGFSRFLNSLTNRNLKAIYKAGYLYEFKFDKIPGGGKKRCLVVTKESVMGTSIEEYVGIPMPAVYPKAGSC